MTTKDEKLSKTSNFPLADVKNLKIGVVVSDWNKEITARLLDGSIKTLNSSGISNKNICVKHVPGSFELIHGAKRMQERNFDAIIVIGCLIKGETKHFDYICQGVTDGIKQLNIINEIPIIFCVLMDENIEQSIDRSGGKYGNRGMEAAYSAIKMSIF